MPGRIVKRVRAGVLQTGVMAAGDFQRTPPFPIR